MSPETREIARTVLSVVASSKAYTSLPTSTELFVAAETIISALASLIGPKLDLEQKYRQEIKQYIEEGDSVAKAEVKAKAGDNYKEWRKLENVYELGEMQTQMMKKFKDELQGEYRRS